MTVSSFIEHLRWSRPRCPELVAGSGKHVEVVMWSNDVQEVSTIGHVVVVGSPYHMYPLQNGDSSSPCKKEKHKTQRKRKPTKRKMSRVWRMRKKEKGNKTENTKTKAKT